LSVGSLDDSFFYRFDKRPAVSADAFGFDVFADRLNEFIFSRIFVPGESSHTLAEATAPKPAHNKELVNIMRASRAQRLVGRSDEGETRDRVPDFGQIHAPPFFPTWRPYPRNSFRRRLYRSRKTPTCRSNSARTSSAGGGPTRVRSLRSQDSGTALAVPYQAQPKFSSSRQGLNLGPPV